MSGWCFVLVWERTRGSGGREGGKSEKKDWKVAAVFGLREKEMALGRGRCGNGASSSAG